MNKNWLLYLLLFLLVILIRLPAFELPIDNDSSANAYHARLINQGEPLYGTHHPAHHLPATYYTYAMVFRLFGDQPISLQMFLVIWMWLNGLIIFKIVETFSNKKIGFISAAIFILVSSMTNLKGETATAVLFANVPLSLILLLSINLFTSQKKPYMLFIIGVVGAIGFLFKAVYITSLIAVSLTLFLELMLQPTKKYILGFLKNISLMLLGFILVIGFVVSYFSLEGLFSRFLLVFHVGSQYVSYSESPWYFIFLIPIILIANANFSLLVFGFLSSYRLFLHFPTSIKQNKTKTLLHFLIVSWLFTSFVAAGFSRIALYHYGLLLIPPLSVLFGIEISELWSRIQKQKVGFLTNIKKLILICMVLIVTSNTFFSSSHYINGYINYRLGKIKFAQFAAYHTSMGPNNVIAQEVSTYINQNTNQDDFIFCWTELVQIYYLSNRRSPLDVIWPINVSSFGSPEQVLELNPVYIVTGPFFLYDEDIPSWLSSELENSYHLEKIFNPLEVYKINNSEG